MGTKVFSLLVFLPVWAHFQRRWRQKLRYSTTWTKCSLVKCVFCTLLHVSIWLNNEQKPSDHVLQRCHSLRWNNGIPAKICAVGEPGHPKEKRDYWSRRSVDPAGECYYCYTSIIHVDASLPLTPLNYVGLQGQHGADWKHWPGFSAQVCTGPTRWHILHTAPWEKSTIKWQKNGHLKND